MSAGDATATVEERPRGGAWKIFIPTVLLLLLAGAWTGFWFYAAHRANEAIDVWLKREADHGRVYACADKQIVGYPFRVELVCDKPSARLPADGGVIAASAPKFHAVAQVYDPSHLIGELTGPVEIVAPDGRKSTLTYALAQSSVVVSGKTFERASIFLNEPKITAESGETGGATAAQFHLRKTPEKPAGTFDLAAKIDNVASPAFDALPIGQGPVSLELQAEASGVDDLKPGPTSERLKAFAAANGRVHLALARIVRGDVAAEARGDFNLTEDGKIDGKFDVVERGVDDVIASMMDGAGGGKKNALGSLLGIGAKMLGSPAQLDGKPATTYRVNVENGKVALGPIKIYKIPPAF